METGTVSETDTNSISIMMISEKTAHARCCGCGSAENLKNYYANFNILKEIQILT
jgi:hypothetical protein